MREIALNVGNGEVPVGDSESAGPASSSTVRSGSGVVGLRTGKVKYAGVAENGCAFVIFDEIWKVSRLKILPSKA
jgi:hypothetical protein